MFISHWLLDDLSELSGSLFTSRDDKTYKECAAHMNDAKVFLLFLSIICEMVKICVIFKSFRELKPIIHEASPKIGVLLYRST